MGIRQKLKRNWWKILLAVILVLLLMQVPVTGWICNWIFARYDVKAETPGPLTSFAEKRESVRFPCGEHTLQGYRYLSGKSRGLIVLAPGFHAGADDFLWLIYELCGCGWDVFTFDPTGCCDSEGDSNVGFSQTLPDLHAALTYVEKTYTYDGAFLLGHSRGGFAVCSVLGEEHDIRGAVSVNGLNSAVEAMRIPAEQEMGAFAYESVPFLWVHETMRFGWSVGSRQAAGEIARSEVPVLVIQSSADTISPPENGSIYAHRGELPEGTEILLWDEPGHDGHTDIFYDDDGTANDDLVRTLDRFYGKQLKTA